MGLIDRIRQHRAAAPQAASQAAPVPDGSSIEPIPPLTASDTAWLVNYATATLTELGRRVAGMDGQALVTDDQHSFGLTNLARKLFGTPREEWPAIVRAQVMAINSSMDRSPREGNETLFHFFPKLMYLADFPTEMRDRIENYAFDLAPDLRVLASVDNPQTVETLTTSERLRPFGGWAGAYPRLLDNLRALPAPHHVVQDRIHVWISADDDFYGATRVLILEELLAKVDDPFSEYGVLVVMPTRNLLGALVIRSFEDTVTGVSRLLNYAAGQFAQRPGPLVPHVYYQASANATLQQLTYPTDDKVQVHVTGAFETMISRLLPQ